jgi:hypothetical protein
MQIIRPRFPIFGAPEMCGGSPQKFPTQVVADLTAQVNQIDGAITEATRRGRTTEVMSIIEAQRRTRSKPSAGPVRGSWMSETGKPVSCGKAQDRTRHRGRERPAGRSRVRADPLRGGIARDRQRQRADGPMAGRTHWLCCDQLAIDGRGLGPAINHRLKPHLVRSVFDSCRASSIEGHSG